MKARSEMEQACASIMNPTEMAAFLCSLEIRVSISPKSNYIKCWNNQCLGQEFALFQSNLTEFRGFENCLEPNQQDQEVVQSLKNGQYDATLNLVAYKSSIKHVKTAPDVDTLYLKPETSLNNPGEWIACQGHSCDLHWFRDGLWVDVSFERTLLLHHATIRQQIDQKLDTFIQPAT